MSGNPYLIKGPALISFSGGRTSAFMLRQIIEAHGRKLPDDVIVVFANTGKERDETLRFVKDCAFYWDVPVRWVEWQANKPGFVEVNYETASRNGEPFESLIAKKKYLPNAVARFCTQELKIKAMRDFALSLGWDGWNNVIGLRYDEGRRVFKALEDNDARAKQWLSVMPMSTAKHTHADVVAFWQKQAFNLHLRSYEGNCDLCFLKARAKLLAIMQENPGIADWWIGRECSLKGAKFVTEHSYAELAAEIERQGFFPFHPPSEDEHDAECGLHCGGGIMNMLPRFNLADAERAFEEWGCNCGPSALAAIMGMTLDEVRPHIPGFDAKRYTNPTMMEAALRSIGRPWRKIGTQWPEFGLVRIQWEGPWTLPGVPIAARYRFTHWVGGWNTPDRGYGVFDINTINNGSGWTAKQAWETVCVPYITQHVPRATGAWHVTHGIEVTR